MIYEVEITKKLMPVKDVLRWLIRNHFGVGQIFNIRGTCEVIKKNGVEYFNANHIESVIADDEYRKLSSEIVTTLITK